MHLRRGKGKIRSVLYHTLSACCNVSCCRYKRRKGGREEAKRERGRKKSQVRRVGEVEMAGIEKKEGAEMLGIEQKGNKWKGEKGDWKWQTLS